MEQLLFFNVNQHRVRVGIQQSIDTYGVPEIFEQDGGLRVRVGDKLPTQGRLVGVSRNDDRVLKVWDVETGEEKSALRGHSRRVSAVASSLDGGLVASAGGDPRLRPPA